MDRITLFMSSPKVLRFLVKLFTVLAVLFGGLAFFVALVPWARPIIWIAISNFAVTAAMATLNSVILDKMEKNHEHCK